MPQLKVSASKVADDILLTQTACHVRIIHAEFASNDDSAVRQEPGIFADDDRLSCQTAGNFASFLNAIGNVLSQPSELLRHIRNLRSDKIIVLTT